MNDTPANAFQPTLGQILEEPSPFVKGRFDDSLLEDYAVLTERDLLKALDLLDESEQEESNAEIFTFDKRDVDNTDKCNNEVSKNLNSEFASLHKDAKTKNEGIIEKVYSSIPDLDKKSLYETEDQAGEDIEIRKSVSNNVSYVLNDSQNENNDYSAKHNKDNGVEHFKVCSLHSDESAESFGVHFNLVAGRKLFAKAVNHKGMNIYYTLSQHHASGQSDKEMLPSLSIVLSALNIKKNFSGTIELNNESVFQEFAYAARNCDLEVDVVSSVTAAAGMECFRQAVKASTMSQDNVIVCYYIREAPQQHCCGHFGIVSGYYKEKDLILLSDDVLPTRWISVSMIWKTMFDVTTESPSRQMKGYFVLRKPENSPAITMSVNPKVSIKLKSNSEESQKLLSLKEDWENWLSATPNTDCTEESILTNGINHVIDLIKNGKFAGVQTSVSNEKINLSYKEGSLVDSVTKTKVFQVVQTALSALPEEELVKMTQFSEWLFEEFFVAGKSLPSKQSSVKKKKKKKSLVQTSVNVSLFNSCAMLSTCLLFWPYNDQQKVGSNNALVLDFLGEDIETLPKKTVGIFHEKIRFVLKALKDS
ncbi:uncharacterized protein LOC130657052 isoform X2 [Hydractinia symbiolongicarpus]|nr:uncharacterized protein LOC130657052 isoform X2 [Hydractinia symbiolongicarpus]